MDENTIIITDDNGTEKEYEIVLTFDGDQNGRQYVLVTDPEDPDGNVYAFAYDEDGNLDAVTEGEELELCEEVLSAFVSEDGEEND